MNLSLAITKAHAQSEVPVELFDVSGFGNLTLLDIITNIVNTAQLTIVPLGVALFSVGAFLYTLAGDKDDDKQKGKDFMMGAILGVGFVFAAKGFLNLIMFFVYGT